VEQSSPATQASRLPLVLHYTGYDEDYGGVTVAIKRLAAVGAWRTLLGLNAGGVQRREPQLDVMEFPRVEAEMGGGRLLIAGWRVAWRARRWLRENPDGIFHGHSRTGALATALLRSAGETRVLATVHVFGRQRWWYRHLARMLDGRIFWLSPRMKEYYGLGRGTWSECLPDCVSEIAPAHRKPRDAARIFGAVGPIVAVKEWRRLVEAWAVVPAEVRSNLRLVHIGGPRMDERHGEADALRRFAAERGVADAIEWRPRTESLTNFWNEIDCYVGASPREAFGVAALEALAAGVPLLVPAAAGTGDLVEECRGGWCFDGGAPALAVAIERAAQPGALRGWSPDVVAMERFSATSVAARHAGIYRALLRRANNA
jgi:glycosyltransferase involved in cell wall biosynthesis